MSEQATRPSARSLVGDVLDHLTNLVRGEVNLARAEVSETLYTAGAALGMIAGGVVLAITALNVLAAALVSALTEWGLQAGWAALIVGLIFAVVAFVLARKGISDLSASSLAPKRTVRNVRRDANVVRETYNEQ